MTIPEPIAVPMSTWTTACAVTLGCIVVVCLGRYFEISKHASRSFPLPPGPPGLPWAGNITGVDMNAPWLTYTRWAKTYGGLVYTRLLGQHLIILNSEQVAKDLLEHRSRNYSNRPPLVTAELCGIDFITGFVHGDKWRHHRRFFHQSFGSDAVARFRPLQFRKSCRLLHQLLTAPERLSAHISDYTVSIIMNSVYDYDPPSRQDELVQIVKKASEVIVSAVQPEVALIVGAFPFLIHLPSLFPGMGLAKRMSTAKEYARQYVERPFAYSLERLSEFGYSPCMVHHSIQKASDGFGAQRTDDDWMTELKETAATAFIAGADSSNAVIMKFFLLMILYPEVQEKAHAQIDFVLEDRLATIDDRSSLPYIDAILRETYRYNPVAPFAAPHTVLDDDIYSGFRIPKGAVIFINLWSMAYDETRFPNPDKFIPERFLADDGSLLPNDTEHLSFGFGRRVCPGRHISDTSIWTAICNVLAVFRISKAKDTDGVEIPVEPRFTTGVVLHPLPFAYSITPRKPGMDAQKLERLIAASTVVQ